MEADELSHVLNALGVTGKAVVVAKDVRPLARAARASHLTARAGELARQHARDSAHKERARVRVHRPDVAVSLRAVH